MAANAVSANNVAEEVKAEAVVEEATKPEVKAARAYLADVRIAPRKVQIVLDLIRGKDVEMAKAILKNTPKRGAEILEKVLKSAVSNAENNHQMDVSKLYVSKCFVTPGSHMLKRILPRGKGSANRILKRTSHITIVVQEKE